MKTNEVEAFPGKGQHFSPAKDRGAVFLSEDEVLSEAELYSAIDAPQIHSRQYAAVGM